MTEQDMEVQELRRENKKLKEQIAKLECSIIEDIYFIEDYYKDVEEEFIYYLNELKELGSDNINNHIRKIFNKKGRCPFCGSKFETMYYRAYHSEVDAHYEPMLDIYCPNCDIRG